MSTTFWVVTEVKGSHFKASAGAPGKGLDVEMSFCGTGRPAVGDTIETGVGTGYKIIESVYPNAPEFRYLNFPLEPETDEEALNRPTKDLLESRQRFITHSPYSFRDVPAGSKTLEAKNGAVVIAGESMSGIVMTASNKILLRDDNSMEIVSPHSVTMLGHTVTVSSFSEGFTLEIDLVDTGKIGKSSIAPFIEAVHALVKEGMIYSEAYRQVIGDAGGPLVNIINLFGLHIADIVMASKWTRIKIIGNVEHVESSYFSGGPINISELGYYTSSLAKCSYLESFLTKPKSRSSFDILSPPKCWDMKSSIIGIRIKTEDGEREVSSAIMHLSSGRVINYSQEEMSYFERSAVVGKEIFTSGHTHKSSALVFHRDHETELMAEIRIGSSGSSLCGQPINFARLVFTEDANILIEGDLSLSAQGKILMQSPSTARIMAGGKGLLVDDSGVSTTS